MNIENSLKAVNQCMNMNTMINTDKIMINTDYNDSTMINTDYNDSMSSEKNNELIILTVDSGCFY